MSEINEKRRPVKYYADTRAKYEQYVSSGQIKEGDECWIEETREIVVFGNSFGGDYTKKQDKLVDGENIKTINGESLLGKGNLQINVDTSSLATKVELQTLQNEVIANEEVIAHAFDDVNNRLNDISENVCGTTVTKEEFETTVADITNEIVTNEEITAAAFNDLRQYINTTFNDLRQYVNTTIEGTITNTLNTEV